MVRTAIATGDAPEPASVQVRRFQLSDRAVISRSRMDVWQEYAQLDHPAWSEHPEGKGPAQRVGAVRGLAVGAATMYVLPGASPTGVRNLVYSVVSDVHPGHLATMESIVTGSWEMTETIRFTDHPSGGTLVDLSSWVNTVPLTEAKAARLQYNLGRIQRGFLARAERWTPGIGYTPKVITPEAEDLNAGD